MKAKSLWLLLFLIGYASHVTALTAQARPAGRSTALGKRVVVYTTADSTPLRLAPTDTLLFKQAEPITEAQIYVFVDPRRTFQTMIGIGGALTDAAAETFAKLPAARQEEVMTAYYSPERGIGYTLGRTNINSCDFSSDMYTYVTEGDTTLSSFTIAHDLHYLDPAHQARAGRQRQSSQAIRQSVEPAGVHEGQQRHVARRASARRAPPNLGPLLHEVHRELSARGRAGLADHDSERADGHADVGVMHLPARRRARFSARLSRTRHGAARAEGCQHHRLGPQSRPDRAAGADDLRRPQGGAVRVGHRIPLVRRLVGWDADVRQRRAGEPALSRQAHHLHRRHAGELRLDRLRPLEPRRGVRALHDSRFQFGRRGVDRLEHPAR